MTAPDRSPFAMAWVCLVLLGCQAPEETETAISRRIDDAQAALVVSSGCICTEDQLRDAAVSGEALQSEVTVGEDGAGVPSEVASVGADAGPGRTRAHGHGLL